MILSIKRTTYPALAQGLDKGDKIVVLSCNNCAKKCLGLGGRVGLQALADKLEDDGFEVLRRELVGFACSTDLVGKRGKEESTRHWFQQADVILTLACEDAEIAVRNAFPDKRVPSLSHTLGIGWGSPSAGIWLTHTITSAGLELDGPISLQQAAERLGLEAGSY